VRTGSRASAGHSGTDHDLIATVLDGLPGFIAGDIAALLQDLLLQAAGYVPGMTMEEAIENLYTTCCIAACYTACYVTPYIMIFHNMLYNITCNKLLFLCCQAGHLPPLNADDASVFSTSEFLIQEHVRKYKTKLH
jgi:hypothetical protein